MDIEAPPSVEEIPQEGPVGNIGAGAMEALVQEVVDLENLPVPHRVGPYRTR